MNKERIALYGKMGDHWLVSPRNAVGSMFEYTDGNGILYIPEWPREFYPFENGFFRCVMHWKKDDAQRFCNRFEDLISVISQLARKWNNLSSGKGLSELTESHRTVWNTYLKKFDTSAFDMEQINNIKERIEAIEAGIVKDGYKTGFVTEKEKDYYSEYRDALIREAEVRLGRTTAAYDTVLRGRQLGRMMATDAPAILVKNETFLFVQALVMNTYCEQMTLEFDVP